MNGFRQEEYKALRATIRERGTVRAITFLASIVAWAALVLLLHLGGARDTYGTFISLVVLVAGFEAVFQIHVGVERVGRYLQVFYESPPPVRIPEVGSPEPDMGPSDAAVPDPAAGQAPTMTDGIQMWETVAMAYGKAYPPIGSGSLFSVVYLIAALFNMLPVLRAVQDPPVFAGVVTAHLVFVLRVRIAVRQAAAQRAEDLERFQKLRQASR